MFLQIIWSNYSPIAQSVEQVAVNHLVDGSSPSRGAKKFKARSYEWAFLLANQA
jgi:hypothetical protein